MLLGARVDRRAHEPARLGAARGRAAALARRGGGADRRRLARRPARARRAAVGARAAVVRRDRTRRGRVRRGDRRRARWRSARARVELHEADDDPRGGRRGGRADGGDRLRGGRAARRTWSSSPAPTRRSASLWRTRCALAPVLVDFTSRAPWWPTPAGGRRGRARRDRHDRLSSSTSCAGWPARTCSSRRTSRSARC